MVNLTLIKTNNLAEIFQALDIKFAFVNDKYEQVSVPCKCRDFLGDCVWSYKTGKSVSIYDFKYSFQDKPYDLDVLRLSLKFPDLESKAYFLENQPALAAKCEQAGVEPPIVLETQFEDTLIIEADNIWQQSSWKLSLFTFYIKIFSYRDLTQLANPENGYIKHLTKEVEDVYLDKLTTEMHEHLYSSVDKQHNFNGWIEVAKGTHNKEQHSIVFGD